MEILEIIELCKLSVFDKNTWNYIILFVGEV